MIRYSRILIITLVVVFTSCNSRKWTVTHIHSTKIALDASTDVVADKAYQAYLQPIKSKLDAEMDIVIGHASQTMMSHAPESLLSNLSADIYLQAASDALNEPVDIAIVNLGGIRTQIPQGDIAVRKVFELMPFENELVVLWLRGNLLQDLLQYFARMGGQGVAGIKMTIENKQANDISIGGMALDPDKLYSIATNDYLAGGNDQMVQLAHAEKNQFLGIKVRDMLMDYIKNETKQGRMIQSQLDGRITLKK